MKQFSAKIYKTVLLALLLSIGINGCKDDYVSVVPSVYVNFTVNPTNIIELNIPGGSYYFGNEGYGGIIIVNNWGDSTVPFLAFDASCTHEVSSLVRVEVNENGSGIASCPECGSQFMIFGSNGSPIKGPAIEPLKQYHATVVGGRISVTN